MKKTSDIKQRALSPNTVADMYDLNVGTLANLRHAKKGPKYYKINKKVIYFMEDIEAWIRQDPVLTSDSID